MKEHPIPFSGPMIRAIQDEERPKTVTRRPIKLTKYMKCCDSPALHCVPHNGPNVAFGGPCYLRIFCKSCDAIERVWPRWAVGDEPWVKETHFLFGKWVKNGKAKTGKQAWRFKRLYNEVMFPDAPPGVICTKKTEEGWFKRPSIFMPRWASRIQLVVKSVRIERLQEISPPDCEREGICPWLTYDGGERLSNKQMRGRFRALWHKVYAKKPEIDWDANPWVWRVEFERKTKEANE